MLVQGAVLCCSCCCSEIGQACKKLMGPRKLTKLNYLFVVIGFMLTIVAVTLILHLSQSIINLPFGTDIFQSSKGISFSLLILFLIMLLIIQCHNRISMVINEGLFTVKYLFLIVLYIVMLFLGSSIFPIYEIVAKYASVLYMILQSIILIDLFYIFGKKLAKQYSQGSQAYGGLLITLTIIFQAVSIFLNVLGYIRYSSDSCGNSLWPNIVLSLLLVLLPIAQLLNLNTQNSLLTTSLVSFLMSYYCYSALISFGQSCTLRLNTLNYALDVLVNIFLLILTTFGSITGGLSDSDESAAQSKDKQQEISLRQYEETNIWTKWLFFMCLASVYIYVVITNWGSRQTINNIHGSTFAFTVRIIVSIFTGVVYIWTMVAPYFLPSRNFQLQ